VEEQYNILLELQKIDIDIDKEEKKKRSLPLMIEGITKKIQGLKDSLKNKNENYKNLQIKLKRKELDLAEKSNKINKHQEDLYGGKISDIKELKQIQKVIAKYKDKGKQKELVAPAINSLSKKKFFNALQGSNSSVMPKYFLTNNEIEVLYFYVTSEVNQ